MHPACLIVAHLATGLVTALAYFAVLDRLAPGHDMTHWHALALLLGWPVSGPILFGRLLWRAAAEKGA